MHESLKILYQPCCQTVKFASLNSTLKCNSLSNKIHLVSGYNSYVEELIINPNGMSYQQLTLKQRFQLETAFTFPIQSHGLCTGNTF